MDKDKRANRYSLKLITFDKEEIIIPINYNGETLEKMPLSKIDLMTTHYSENELKDTLISLGYPKGNLFIEYKVNGQIKTLNVVYNDISEITEECKFRESELAKGNKEPKISENVILLFYKLLKAERYNKKLWSHLQRKKHIWTNITLAVATYNYLIDIKADEEELLYYQNETLKIIGDYKKYRDIYCGIDEFYKIEKKQTKQKYLKR